MMAAGAGCSSQSSLGTASPAALGKNGGGGGGNTRVFLGNIPWEASEEEVMKECSVFGRVVSFKLVRDRETGRHKGFGFMDFADEETALSAIRNQKGLLCKRRQLRVSHPATTTNARRPPASTTTSSTRSQSYNDNHHPAAAQPVIPLNPSKLTNQSKKRPHSAILQNTYSSDQFVSHNPHRTGSYPYYNSWLQAESSTSSSTSTMSSPAIYSSSVTALSPSSSTLTSSSLSSASDNTHNEVATDYTESALHNIDGVEDQCRGQIMDYSCGGHIPAARGTMESDLLKLLNLLKTHIQQ